MSTDDVVKHLQTCSDQSAEQVASNFSTVKTLLARFPQLQQNARFVLLLLHPRVLASVLMEISPTVFEDHHPILDALERNSDALNVEDHLESSRDFHDLINRHLANVSPYLKAVFESPGLNLSDFVFDQPVLTKSIVDDDCWRIFFQRAKSLTMILGVSMALDNEAAATRSAFMVAMAGNPGFLNILGAVFGLVSRKGIMPKLKLRGETSPPSKQGTVSASSMESMGSGTLREEGDDADVLRVLETKYEEAYQKVQELQDANRGLRDRLARLEHGHMIPRESDQDEANAELIEAENIQLRKELEEVKKEAKETKKAFESQIQGLKAEMGELSQYHEQYIVQSDQITRLKEKLSEIPALNERINELELELSEKVGELVMYENSNQSTVLIKNMMEQKEALLAEKEQECLDLESATHVLHSQIETLQSQLSAAQREIVVLHKELEISGRGPTSMLGLDDLGSDSVSALKTQIARLQKQIELGGNTSPDIAKIAELEIRVESLTRTNDALKAKYHSLLASTGGEKALGTEHPSPIPSSPAHDARLDGLRRQLVEVQQCASMEKIVLARVIHRAGMASAAMRSQFRMKS